VNKLQTDVPAQKSRKRIPFFPDYLLDEVIAWFVGLAILVVLASLFPAGLEDKANPLLTPAHVKPEWYFLFLYQTLKLVPRIVGVLLPGVAILFMLLLPFIDRRPATTLRSRAGAIVAGTVILLVIAALTIWGSFP
jgi:quinol-cytochrome oxidoreductase complex cytochrome b subunit